MKHIFGMWVRSLPVKIIRNLSILYAMIDELISKRHFLEGERHYLKVSYRLTYLLIPTTRKPKLKTLLVGGPSLRPEIFANLYVMNQEPPFWLKYNRLLFE